MLGHSHLEYQKSVREAHDLDYLNCPWFWQFNEVFTVNTVYFRIQVKVPDLAPLASIQM